MHNHQCRDGGVKLDHTPTLPAEENSGMKKRTAKVQERLDAIYEFAKTTYFDIAPITVRSAFYHLVSLDLVPKTKNGANNVVTYMTEMREDGQLPWEWVADETRQIRGEILSTTDYPTGSQRDNLINAISPTWHYGGWMGQHSRVQIWCEKEGLTQQFQHAIRTILPYGGVQFIACKGYASVGFLNEIAKQMAADIEDTGMEQGVFYFGDFDPSGWDIFNAPANGIAVKLPRYVERHLGRPPDELTLEWCGVREEHIDQHNLPTRPPSGKPLPESKRKRFPHERYVEINAMPPPVIQEMIHQCIRDKVDLEQVQAVQAKNVAEHQKLVGLRERVDEMCDDLADEGFRMD